jgi:hypothetical protein
MAVKSVIEIDVLDEKFKAFQAAFEKYKKSLADQNKQWEKFNKQIAEAEKRQKDLNKALKDGFSALQGAAGLAAGIATSMASAAVSAAKWLALGAIGGGFGFGGLASSASDYRRQAQGLGVSTGQIRGANVTFGRYINPDQTLANIAEIQSDLSRRQILGRLGGQQGQNPAEMLPTIIQNAVNQFKAGGKTQQYAEAMGLTQVFSMDELRRLSSLSREELHKTIEEFKRDQELLKLDDATSRAWQDFWYHLKLSGNQIENSLIKNLVALEPKLDKLRENITKVAELLIDKLGAWLASPDFEKDTEQFIDALESLGKQVIRVAKWFGLIKTTPEEKTKEADAQTTRNKNLPRGQAAAAGQIQDWLKTGTINPRNAGMAGVNDKQKADMAALELQYGLPAGTLSRILKAEHSSPNSVSSSGAMGKFQLGLEVRSDYGVTNPQDFFQSDKAAAAYFASLLKHYSGNVAEAFAAYNWGQGNLDKYLHHEKGAKTLPSETRKYVEHATGQKLIIQNDTGGQTVLNTVPMQ